MDSETKGQKFQPLVSQKNFNWRTSWTKRWTRTTGRTQVIPWSLAADKNARHQMAIGEI